jgi:C1A family cysteine protease
MNLKEGNVKIKIGILCICLLLVGSLGFLFLHAQNDTEPMLAPLNPAFLKMIEAKQAGMFYQDPKLGYIPGPVDHSYFTAIAAPTERPVESYAASYDLRTYNKVTPIKDQGQCGACWAFSAMGGIESSLLPTETRNFAEQHLNKYHGFDGAECGGGNTNMSAAYFARWDGPYNESDYQYPYSSNASGSAAVQKHVQRAVWLPKDNDTIKAFVSSSSYGAVSFAFNATNGIESSSTDSYYNAPNYAYYYPTSAATNHEILIIGWDDNFAKTKFSTTPAGNGAWLCRNSWGTSWGNSGYFWMSYYDATIADLCVFSFVQPANNYKTIYQYDPLGWVYGFGNGATTYWSANIFTATTNDPLKSIGYVTTDACNIHYYIYKNPTATNPTSGTLVAQGTDSFSYPCYLTTDLSAPVILATGDKFSVVIQFVNNSYKYPAALEGIQSGYSSGATNAAGQSFYSSNGSSWTDYYNYSSNTYKFNCCIKAFTGATVYMLTIQASTSGTTNPVPGTYACLPGTDVPILALPDQHCVLLGWSGDASGTANPITIHMDGNKSVTASFKLVSPPSNLTAVRLTNRSVTQTEYIVDLSWGANTANSGLNIVVYRVYQLVEDSWVNLTDLPTNNLTCRVRMVPKEEQTFGVASVNEGGVESARITIVK